MSSERDSFAKGIFSTFAKGFLLHKLLLKVNFSPLRVKKSRSHDMGHCVSNKTYKEQSDKTHHIIVQEQKQKLLYQKKNHEKDMMSTAIYLLFINKEMVSVFAVFDDYPQNNVHYINFRGQIVLNRSPFNFKLVIVFAKGDELYNVRLRA
jgi:hypothetical protein